MSTKLSHQWKILEKATSQEIGTLTSVDVYEMFWIVAEFVPTPLFDKYKALFHDFTYLNPDDDPEMEQWGILYDELFSQLSFESIGDAPIIKETILYIFDDLTIHFRAIFEE